MAVPKQKKSKSRKLRNCSRLKTKFQNYQVCKLCGGTVVAHRVCHCSI